jgi:ADP-ribosylglycohydrolase
LSLEGLSVGDTFGERFFGLPEDALRRIAQRELCPPPWTYTDDTEMALSIVEVLRECGEIDQDLLAQRFARRMQFGRGYGQGTYAILCALKEGRDWRALTQAGFRGMGSFGNGAAMRVAPLGAFFAEASVETVCEQARLSAEVTHCHPEGIAGGSLSQCQRLLLGGGELMKVRWGPLGSRRSAMLSRADIREMRSTTPLASQPRRLSSTQRRCLGTAQE